MSFTSSTTSTQTDAKAAFASLRWPTQVLIVDDAASTRRLLRGILSYSPHFDVVGEASNGMAAIAEATVLQPDVILLDVSMPVMDGIDALSDLLRVAPYARIVVVSGADEKAATGMVEAGALAFVPKGMPPLELLARLDEILGLASDERPEPVPIDHGRIPLADARTQPAPRAVICDDDPTTRRLVAQLLETIGLEVIAETDQVPNLLAVMRLAQPEFVILDLWLEGITGTAALPDCRLVSPSSLVIVYSAHELYRPNALAAGAAAFVAKPRFDQLGAEIRQLSPMIRPVG